MLPSDCLYSRRPSRMHRLAFCVSLIHQTPSREAGLTDGAPSVIEMQAISAMLMENFEFALPPQTEETTIRRKPAGVMAPMADGYPGIWMGLRVKAVT
jgi:hypothetical protein